LEKTSRRQKQAEREKNRLAALERQQALEAWAAYRRSTPARRMVYPADYRPRRHYNYRSLMAWEAYRKAGEQLRAPEPDPAEPDSK
jgi:hypothetical protein